MRKLLLLIPVILVASSAWAKPAPSLYKRLGAKPGITKIVNRFVNTLSSDPRLMANPKLKEASIQMKPADVKRDLVEKLCEASGGPCKVKRAIFLGAPPDTKLAPAEWFYVIQGAMETLKAARVSEADQREMIGLLTAQRK